MTFFVDLSKNVVEIFFPVCSGFRIFQMGEIWAEPVVGQFQRRPGDIFLLQVFKYTVVYIVIYFVLGLVFGPDGDFDGADIIGLPCLWNHFRQSGEKVIEHPRDVLGAKLMILCLQGIVEPYGHNQIAVESGHAVFATVETHTVLLVKFMCKKTVRNALNSCAKKRAKCVKFIGKKQCEMR